MIVWKMSQQQILVQVIKRLQQGRLERKKGGKKHSGQEPPDKDTEAS
jgi:hypothetical protein